MAADRERSEWVWRAATVSSLEQFIHRSPTCRMRDSRKKTSGDGKLNAVESFVTIASAE